MSINKECEIIKNEKIPTQNELIKIYETQFVQIYQNLNTNKNKSFKGQNQKKNKNSKNDKYEYIYRYLNSSSDNIQFYKSNQFPYNLLTISTGFLFINSNEQADIPTLPNIEYKDYKTNLKCLSNGFINQKDINTVMEIRPGKNCHPNCVNSYTIGLKIEIQEFKIDKVSILKKFIEIQPSFKNINEWKSYIYQNCPTHIHFTEKINNDTFNKKISENDMYVDYDIHDENEIKIIQIIENTFENMNQTVKIFDNYNNIVDRIRKECDIQKIKYSSSENIKHKKLKYKGEIKNMRYQGIKWIELKYSDLLKCNIKYTLTDFIS